MESLFIKILNLSITGGYVIIAVLIARLLLKKAPSYIRCLLWGLVALRLVIPFSLESIFSLIPSKQVVGEGILYSPIPSIYSGIAALNSTINPVLETSFSPAKEAAVTPMERLMGIAAYIWIAGMIALMLYGAYSYITIKKRVAEAVPLEGNIYYTEAIATPFILGFLKPKIYLPFSLEEQNLYCVLAHEKAHLRRKDHLVKPIAYLILTVYWFNPLVWFAYLLLTRDIELACDEKVLKELGNEGKKAYSTALLNCSINRKTIAACPVAFGEVGVKERVKNALSYKKPSFWIILAAAFVSIIVAICFLTSPKDTKNAEGQYLGDVNSAFEGIYSVDDLVYLTPLSSSTPGYFLDGYAKDRFVITKDSLTLDTSLKTESGGAKDFSINNVKYTEEELEDKIYTMGEDFPGFAIDIYKYKNTVGYKLLNGSNEDSGYRLYFLDGEVWLAYYTLTGGSPDKMTWTCWYILSLKKLEGTATQDYDKYPKAKRIVTGYLARSYVEFIEDEATLSESTGLYYNMLVGDKALKLPGEDFYMVDLEFSDEKKVKLVFFDNNRYGLMLPDSNEYLPVINSSKEVYQKFYDLYSVNRDQ